MSQQTEDQEKSMDKKEIAEEEREKMLNAENTKHTGAAPAPDLESEEQKPKKKIPIGGIKMPGFYRTKSKEPCRDEETKPTGNAETVSVAMTAKEGERAAAATTPSKEAKEKEGRRGILDAIRLPLVSVFPRKKHKEDDAEIGTSGAAGLASVETLDDTGEKTGLQAVNEDGMETVRLDGDAADNANASKEPAGSSLAAFISAARRNLFVTLATLCILLVVIVIVCIALLGPRKTEVVQPIKDGRYIEAVTSCGNVMGVLEDGGFAFRGIPYAVPPVESRRWQPAESLHKLELCWNGTYDAVNASTVCWQREEATTGSSRYIGSEDCLYLDVFTPQVKYDSPLPVVVMIGTETLSGPSPGVMQPSAKLARVRDMVFVRPNFRLGVFGFLAVEPLSRSTHPPTSGNYGLSDIIAALRWVQTNIHHFGGDTKAVTLWGHRAGGTLVTSLVGIRKTKGLFARAWISSGSAIFPGRELAKSEELNEPFLQAIGCSDASCMRNRSPEKLMDAVPKNWYMVNPGLPEPHESTTLDRRHQWLVLDGDILQEHVGQIWTREELRVKIIIGTTSRSGTLTRLPSVQSTVDDSDKVRNFVRESLLGTSGLDNEVFQLYNATLEDLVRMTSDIRVVCPLLTLARMKNDISFYVATRPRNLTDPDSDAAAILGSYAARTSEQKRHVSAVQQLFNRFVWHGEIAQADPKGAKRVLIVDQDILPADGYPNCDFWIKNDIVPTYGRVD